MKKNKIKALIMSAVMVVSCLHFNMSFAESTEEATGKVWHDWDFESTASPAGWINEGSDDRVIFNHEKYGKGMALKSGKEAKEIYTLPETVNTGVVNISYDFIGDAERGNEHLSFNYFGNEDDRRYVLFMTDKDQFKMGKDSLVQWGDSSKIKDIELGKLYHIDLVFDFNNLEYKSYANGELIGTSKLSSENDIKNTYWCFNNSYFFDNFRMAQIDENSYEIQKQYWSGDYLEILLSEGAGEAEHALTVSDFTVTDAKSGAIATPSDVEVVGRRVIFSGLDKTSEYNVTFPEDFKNFMGKKLNSESSVWHDWDFEDSVAPAGWLNEGSDDRVLYTHKKYGKGMALAAGKIAKVFYNPGETINTGVVNISYDFIGDEERGHEILSFNSDGSETGRKYVFLMTGEDKFMMGKDQLAPWGDSTKVKDIELGKLYHIDLVFDFETLEYKSYANGELSGTSKLSSENNIQNTYWYFDNSYFFDNFRMAKIEEDSYKIQKIYWVGDYLEILLSEGAGEAEHALTVSDFTVTDAKSGAVATPSDVEVVGRRVIFSGLDKTSEYNVTFPESFKNFMGTPLFEKAEDIPKERKTNLRLTSDTFGTELTEDIRKTLVPGDKVYAELTYKNTTGASESFIVFGASYSGGKMTDVNFKEITSDGKDTKNFTEYIEIDVTDSTDLSFKTFVWDSVFGLNPDVKINTEYQLLGEEYTRFLGRGETKGNGRTFNWPNAGFEFEFSGDKAEVYASSSNNDSSEYNGNYFTMAVYDGDELVRTKRIKLVAGWNTVYEKEEGDPTSKTIMLVRSSEACRGTVALSKLRCDLRPEPTKPREKHIEFIGDSYTAGYGNSTHLSDVKTWYCAQNTDNWNSYTGMVARHFGADNTVIAYQGKGVYANRDLEDKNGNVAEQFNYADIYVTKNATEAASENMSTKALHDFSKYQPHLVSVWLGTNDSAAPVDQNTFKGAYEALLDNIRSKYPEAVILCVAINNSTYHSTINSIVSERGEDDDYYMLTLNPFQSTTLGHPDVAEDERIAEQFINKINSIDGVWN